jgi:hypothetical protein
VCELAEYKNAKPISLAPFSTTHSFSFFPSSLKMPISPFHLPQTAQLFLISSFAFTYSKLAFHIMPHFSYIYPTYIKHVPSIFLSSSSAGGTQSKLKAHCQSHLFAIASQIRKKKTNISGRNENA